MYPQSMFLAKVRFFSSENCHFYSCKNRCLLHRLVIVMLETQCSDSTLCAFSIVQTLGKNATLLIYRLAPYHYSKGRSFTIANPARKSVREVRIPPAGVHT